MADYMGMDTTTRNYLMLLSVAPQLRQTLHATMTGLSIHQQKALLCILTFRMMGAVLPASIELLRRLPPFTSTHVDNIGAAFQSLVDKDIITVISNKTQTDTAFHWKELDRIIEAELPRVMSSPSEDESSQSLFFQPE
jgi:hypothetical protein